MYAVSAPFELVVNLNLHMAELPTPVYQDILLNKVLLE